MLDALNHLLMFMLRTMHRFTIKNLLLLSIFLGGCLLPVSAIQAATLSVSPDTGVYSSNNTFTVSVRINTQGQEINAAEGILSFNPRQLSVVSLDRSSSIFNLWVTDPAFSNSAGTVEFSGGSPAGYTGGAGTVLSITFRSLGSGPARVSFTDGSVLANDGQGSNILSSMSGATYTVQAPSASPEPEVIEYVPPPDTPAAPVIESETHPDADGWYRAREAVLSWDLPRDVTAVRTLLDQNPSSVPTKLYDDPIDSLTLSDLPEGVSYLHVQFRNADGWGRVAHYRLAVDTTDPASLSVDTASSSVETNPEQTLEVIAYDASSGMQRALVKINDQDPIEYDLLQGTSTLTLPALTPGYHTVFVEAFDVAGNSLIESHSFTISAFDKPAFTEYPNELSEQVIPVIRGVTEPNASVDVILRRVGGEPTVYTVTSDADGVFTFIPESTLYSGVYELSAQATLESGAVSEVSNVVRIAVQEPGYIRLGSTVISALSIIIPLLALVAGLIFLIWYTVWYFRRFRQRVRTESVEALEILRREFSELQGIVRTHESAMQSARKNHKLTKAEQEMIEALDRSLQESQETVEKEIRDVTKLVRPKSLKQKNN